MHVRSDEKSAVGHSGFLFNFFFSYLCYTIFSAARSLLHLAIRTRMPLRLQTQAVQPLSAAPRGKLQYSWVTSLWKSEYVKKKKKRSMADTNRPAEQVVWEAEATRAEG